MRPLRPSAITYYLPCSRQAPPGPLPAAASEDGAAGRHQRTALVKFTAFGYGTARPRRTL